MDEIALIQGDALTVDGWLSLIESREDLITYPERVGTNPFTGLPVNFRPPPTTVRIIRQGSDVGHIRMAEDGSTNLIVASLLEDRETTLSIAEGIATELQSRLIEL